MGRAGGALTGASHRGTARHVAARLRQVAARVLVRPLVGEPVALPAALVARWPELARARWRRGGLPPRVGGWCLGTDTVAAITLWRTIFLGARTRLDDVELLLHELRHVEQFAKDRTFPIQYLWESVRRGYRQNRFEVDAVRYAAHRVRTPIDPSTEDA